MALQHFLKVRNNKASPRYFYHSFPRERSTDPLAVLDSMCRNGLLIVPERLEFDDPLHLDGERKIWMTQERICFTEQTLSELRISHAGKFGSFALEYEPSSIRGLGALPVTYIPTFSPEQKKSFHAAGAAMVSCMTGTISLLNALHPHVDPSSLDDDELWHMTDHKGESHKVYFTRQSRESIHQMMNWLSKMIGRDFEELLGGVETAASLWYPTDYKDLKLSNYWQREWRIIPLRQFARHPLIVDLTELQKDELLKLNARFFSDEIEYPEGPRRRVDECYYIKDVLRRARRLIAPHSYVSSAEIILAKYDIPLNVYGIHTKDC